MGEYIRLANVSVARAAERKQTEERHFSFADDLGPVEQKVLLMDNKSQNNPLGKVAAEPVLRA